MNIKCQVSEETLFWSQNVKKHQPQTTEALLSACFVQVLSPGKASEGRGSWSWKFKVVGGITLDGVRPFKKREWHEQRH